MSQVGAAINEKIARQIEQFQRKCGVHGEEALRFAYHAALPVALNPEFLHLLRINFFLDIESPLPYEVEFEFLLSSLCRQIDEGLYEIERDVRLVLLEGLAREFGQERMREVAMLLWEYVERQEPWAERVGLERAQQLTALSFLNEEQAAHWIFSTKSVMQASESWNRDWLVAMQAESEQASNIQRYIIRSLNSPQESKSASQKIRRILLLAEPRLDNRIHMDSDIKQVESIVNMENSEDQFELRQAWVSTPEDVAAAILDNRPEIIHFSGYFQDNNGLVLRNSFGGSKLVDRGDVDIFFRSYNSAMCAILSSDNSSKQAHLIADYVEYVVYSENEIDGDSLVAFSTGFYQSIANGGSYDEAYHTGLNAIRIAGMFGRLKLINRNREGDIAFDLKRLEFQSSLLSAFPSKTELSQMLRLQLDENLDEIATGKNLSAIILSLLDYHNAQGTLNQLLTAALTEKPKHPSLQNFKEILQEAGQKEMLPKQPRETFSQTNSSGTNFQTKISGGQVYQGQTINIYNTSLPPEETAPPSPNTKNTSARQYLDIIFTKLTQNGATTLTPSGTGLNLDLIAKITDFEPGLGMRGDAFFLFSTFETLTPAGLRTYSAQCLNIAQSYPASSPGRAIFNFRFPTRLCFSVAIVQQLDDATATAIRNNNPFKDAVDVFWYEIPVIFDLSQQQLVYYQEASDFWENFRGEIAWKKLRETIQGLLAPAV